MLSTFNFADMMHIYSVILLISISFVTLHASTQLAQRERADVHDDISLPLELQQNKKDAFHRVSEDTIEPSSTSVVVSHQRQNPLVRKKKQVRHKAGRQSSRGWGSRDRGRPSQREKLTPEQTLRKMTNRLFKRIASFKVPKGYVLPYCFKDTDLKDDIDEISSNCDRMGVDWACVFAEMAGGDNGFSIQNLAAKFDEVEDKSLHRGLQSAIVACDEYWKEYKYEERRRLLLHELETEVLSKTWVEHGEHIGEPYKPKRRANDFENITDPAMLRRALLDAGLADYSVEPISDSNVTHLIASRINRRSRQTGSAPTNTTTKSKRKLEYDDQIIGQGGCLNGGYSAHPWKKRSRRGYNCIESPQVISGESQVTQDELVQDSDRQSDNELEFLCSAGDARCRRDNTMLDRLKQERARKRQEVLKSKELREEARKRIEELMQRVGGGGFELEAMLATSTEGPDIESRLGHHLEREERIEEDLRTQVSSCIAEEATKACENKVLQAISSEIP